MTVWVELEGKELRVEFPSSTFGEIAVYAVESRPIVANAQMLQPGVMSLVVEGRQYRCVLDGDAVLIDGKRFVFGLNDPRSLQGRRTAGSGAAGPRAVKAPMPGRVVRRLVAVGDEVVEQQSVIVIEAMKMQNELKSPKAGKVVRVAVGVGETVGVGDVLVVVE